MCSSDLTRVEDNRLGQPDASHGAVDAATVDALQSVTSVTRGCGGYKIWAVVRVVCLAPRHNHSGSGDVAANDPTPLGVPPARPQRQLPVAVPAVPMTWISLEETAKRCGVSRQWLWRHRLDGPPRHQRGVRVLFQEEEVRELIARNRSP